MIIDRYLIREIIRPLLAVFVVLAVLFVSYSAARQLADTAAGVLPINAVVNLILLKFIIAIEVLLPIALYLAVVVSLGRLHAEYEMTAMAASGISERRVLRNVLRLSLIVAVSVGCLSVFARPWAYHTSYLLKAQAESDFDLNKLEAERFHATAKGNHVIFAGRVDRQRNRMEEVFFASEQGGKARVIYAQQAYQPPTEPGAIPALIFLRGYGYELDRKGNRDRALRFGSLTLYLDAYTSITLGYKRKAASTARLAYSTDPEDTAEFQWRLSRPLETLLLGLLAVPLSRASPRLGMHAKTVSALLVYALYYNLSAMAKAWVKEGMVGSVPGLWWPDALLAMLLLVLLLAPLRVRRPRSIKDRLSP